MRSGKKITAFLLSILMVVSLLPVQVWADGYTLTLDPNFNNESSMIISDCGYYQLPAYPVDYRNNFVHKGWSTLQVEAPGEQETYYNAGATILLSGDLNLYARWIRKQNQYNVTYHSNGGTGADFAKSVDVGSKYTILNSGEVDFSKDGFSFAGWSYSEMGWVDLSPGDQVIIDRPMDLYAVWKQTDRYSPFTDGEEDIVPVNHGYVHMGNIVWRVIGESRCRQLLISNEVLGRSGHWNDAKAYCSDVYNSFSDVEKGAVSYTYKTDKVYDHGECKPADLSGVHLFLLSKIEVFTYFIGNEDRKVDNWGNWWLRSPDLCDEDEAWFVTSSGDFLCLNVYGYYSARPAFVLDLNSVLLTSAASGGKSNAVAGNGEFGDFINGSFSDKKLTLIDTLEDSARKNFTASCSGASGKTIDIKYSGTVTGTGEYVSAIICDDSGSILKYASKTPGTNGSGTWTMTLPDLADGNYTLKVFSEQQNGDYKTDYASPATEIPLKISNGEITKTKENTPEADFTATGPDSGSLSSLIAGAKYTVSGAGIGTTAVEITAKAVGTYDIASGLSAGNLYVVKKGSAFTSDSNPKIIGITKASEPSGVGKTDCRSSANNDGAITGVNASMEYQKSGASGWTAITGSTVTGLAAGTYNVRTKAAGRALASESVSVTVGEYVEPYVPTENDPVVTPPTALNLTYTGEAQELIDRGTVKGGTMYYALADEAGTAGTYSIAVPKATDAGSYTVFYKVVGDNGYNDIPARSISVTIKKASDKALSDITRKRNKRITGIEIPVDASVPKDAGNVSGYGLNAVVSTTGSVKVSNVKVSPEGVVTADLSDGADGDSITIPVKITANNYDCTLSIVITLNDKEDPEYTAPKAKTGLIYNGTEQALIDEGSVTGDDEMQYALEDKEEAYSGAVPAGKDAGNYTVYYRIPGTDTVNGVDPTPVNVSISRKAVTVKAEDKTKEKGDADPSFTAAIDGLIEGEDESLIYFTFSREEGEDAGTYVITPSGDKEQGNYSVSFETGTLTIGEKKENKEEGGSVSEQESPKKPDKVPFTSEGEFYASPEDNFAAEAGSGKINDLVLDFSKVGESAVDPAGLKMTAISGSKFTTKAKLKDKDSFSVTGGVKVKVNKKTLIPSITCKKSGSVTVTLEDGNSYTVTFNVQKPKAQKSEKKMGTGEETVTKTVQVLFGTDINSGSLTASSKKGAAKVSVSGNSLLITPSGKDSIKVQWDYLNKKYKMSIKIK